jgi:predicted PurR-regulated permease PerM
MPAKKLITPFYEKLSLVLIGLIALGYLIILGKEVLDPLIFGFLFAILLLPVSNFFERKLHLPRSLSSVLSILLLIAFIFGIGYLVGSQISNLASDWPQLKTQVMQSVENLQDWVTHVFHVNAAKQMTYIHIIINAVLCIHHDIYFLHPLLPQAAFPLFGLGF